MILSRITASVGGVAGVYVLAALSGVADVDAITLAMARQGGNEIGLDGAAVAVMLAVTSNTIAKSVMGWVIGGAPMGLRLACASIVALAAGASALFVAPMLPAL
jgi:uncharacterized membrane protein (DUF4010 family)